MKILSSIVSIICIILAIGICIHFEDTIITNSERIKYCGISIGLICFAYILCLKFIIMAK
jgi:hypothetical protein